MNHPQNPYIAGNPVSDQDRFIGRADVMGATLRVLRNANTNAIVLHGQRRIGKTSILLRLEKDLMGDDYCPIYFDLQDKAASPLGDVLYQLAQKIAATLQMEKPDRSRFDNDGNFFRDEFLSHAAQQADPRKVVLLFDEFDVLDLPQENQAGSAFFPYLRAWMAQTLDVKFVFVLGRRPEELSTDTLATFKATQSHQVSLISESESLEIIRFSERNQSLYWKKEALSQVWQWTQGHPYFTQLLCSEIWEAAYDDEPIESPTVEGDDIEDAVPDALGQGANAFQWIWNGLPLTERIVMAAMAEERSETISEHQLTELLNRSGVRLILRDLELAPETLERWDLLRRVADADDMTYRFAIPLLRRWVQENKPLRRVKAELDSIEPLAMRLYQSAEDFYGLGDLDSTEQLLSRALNVNPNHMQSRLLLGRVQLGKGNAADAVVILEAVYAFDPLMARQGYVAALLALAEGESDTEQQLAIYNNILEIEPKHPIALIETNMTMNRSELFKKKKEFVSKLLDCPSMRSRHTRDQIIDNLSSQIRSYTRRSNTDFEDVLNMVNVLLNYPNGLDQLLIILRSYEENSISMDVVDRWLDKHGNLLKMTLEEPGHIGQSNSNEIDTANQGYKYDVFLSYANDFSGPWVHKYFKDVFEWYLQDALGREPSIFIAKLTGEEEKSIPKYLTTALAYSRCVVPIWSPKFFKIRWSQYEFPAIRQREKQQGYRNEQNPVELLCPVVISDGDSFDEVAREIPQFNCHNFMNPKPAFGQTPKYDEFMDATKKWIPKVRDAIQESPQWQQEWLYEQIALIDWKPNYQFSLPHIG